MKPLRIILSALAISTIFLHAAIAQIPSVVNISIKGQNYQLVELIEHNNRWYKHEAEYWTYKQLDSTYPLTIYKADYQANKAFLKYVPDHRSFSQVHPHLQRLWFIVNMGSFALNILQVVRI